MRNNYAIFVFLSGLTACGADVPFETAERHGRRSDPIINGDKALEADLDSTVVILDGSGVTCSGTLIAPTVVLTAAHCVKVFDPDTNSFTDTLPATDRTVVAGSLRATDPNAHEYAVATIRVTGFDGTIHPDPGNNPEQLGKADDIALLLLESPVSEQAPTLLLPPSRVEPSLLDGAPLRIAGYGATDVLLSNQKEGDLYVGDTEIERRNDFEMLAGSMNTADTCLGDSGGPAYYFDGGVRFLVGVTSRGAEDANAQCGDGGIWTLAPAYEDWIVEQSDGAYPPDPSAPSASAASGSGGDPNLTDGGCTCRFHGQRRATGWPWLIGLLLAAVWRRRDRQSPYFAFLN